MKRMLGNRKKSEPAARKGKFNKNWYSVELLPCLNISIHVILVLFRIVTVATTKTATIIPTIKNLLG